MKRDSQTKSLWQSEPQPEIPASAIAMEDTYDALIVGAGITGLTTGLRLQQAGKKCLIIEAHHIGYGTSSGTTAHLNTILDTHYYDIMQKFGVNEAGLMAQGATEAISIVRATIEENGIDCHFTFCDGFLYSENKKQSAYLEKVRKSMKDVGILSSYTTDIPIPIPFEKALRVPGQAHFNPVKYLWGMAKAFEAAGGHILRDTFIEQDKVQHLEHYSIAFAGDQPIKTEYIIYATHYPPGLNLLHFECSAHRSYAMAVQLEDNGVPEGVVYDLNDPYHYFRSADVQGKKYLIAGGCDHPTGKKENARQSFEALEAYLRKYFKIRSVDYQWSSQYYKPADGLPYIGRLPGENERTFVATGFSGTGMTLGTLAGKIISDLIVTGDSTFKTLLSPSRIKPVAGFKSMVKQNVSTLKHFVGDRIAIDTIREFADFGHGEGRVVDYRGKNIALYKDEEGHLKALNPVCPHAKCMVQWNNAERSWDCPCHGSRFSPEGHILNGPASQPLEAISLTDLHSEKV